MTTDTDGWIEHDGKGMPVDWDMPVEVEYAGGATRYGKACRWVGWEWSLEPNAADTIVRYRIGAPTRADGQNPAPAEPVMTLRDQFAMHAPFQPIEWPNAKMASDFAGLPEPMEGDVAAFARVGAAVYAKLAYVYADAMMAERSKK